MNSLAPIKEAAALPALIERAASALSNAKSAAEVLEAKEMAGLAYDTAKRAGRLAKAKEAHDTVLADVYRAQADALLIEARAKMLLADEYDAAQERGEVATRQNNPGSAGHVPGQNMPPATASDLGISRKEIHEARQIRDAERADPGITQRVVEEKLSRGEEPTKAALRTAVVEAAQIGLRSGGGAYSSNRNPHYVAPSEAAKAWTHLYGSCRELAEWATETNLGLALAGLRERSDDQSLNQAAVRKAAAILNDLAETISAQR